jgi:hypothetical protein
MTLSAPSIENLSAQLKCLKDQEKGVSRRRVSAENAVLSKVYWKFLGYWQIF